jgi:glycosyltransferase involved in cell wall biosynthesis
MSHLTATAPRVSIGLPVYNGERYLEGALRSLTEQTFTDFEVVICDNASTDSTAEICGEFAARDARFRYFRNEENLGAARNFNLTLELSRGEYFKWFAHDDLLAPTYLEQCVAVLDQAPPSVVLCFPRVKYVDHKGRVLSDEEARSATGFPPETSFHRISLGELLRKPPYCFPILVFGLTRTEVLRQTRGIGAFIMSDVITVAELRLLGDFVEIPDSLMFLRIQPRETTRMHRLEHAGEASWFDPKSSGDKYYPHARLIREYYGSVRGLAKTRSQAAEGYLAITGFMVSTLCRFARERFWRMWSTHSVSIADRPGRAAVQLRVWAAASAARNSRWRQMIESLRGPWGKVPVSLLLFSAERLCRRGHSSTDDVLFSWLTGSDIGKQFAAAIVVAAHQPRFNPYFSHSASKGREDEAPISLDALLVDIASQSSELLSLTDACELPPETRELLTAFVEQWCGLIPDRTHASLFSD